VNALCTLRSKKITYIRSFIINFFFLGGSGVLNSGLCASKADPLPLEPLVHFVLIILEMGVL
jgi:hypothetical protein